MAGSDLYSQTLVNPEKREFKRSEVSQGERLRGCLDASGLWQRQQRVEWTEGRRPSGCWGINPAPPDLGPRRPARPGRPAPLFLPPPPPLHVRACKALVLGKFLGVIA